VWFESACHPFFLSLVHCPFYIYNFFHPLLFIGKFPSPFGYVVNHKWTNPTNFTNLRGWSIPLKSLLELPNPIWLIFPFLFLGELQFHPNNYTFKKIIFLCANFFCLNSCKTYFLSTFETLKLSWNIWSDFFNSHTNLDSFKPFNSYFHMFVTFHSSFTISYNEF
jgi:hypothetical protein